METKNCAARLSGFGVGSWMGKQSDLVYPFDFFLFFRGSYVDFCVCSSAC